MTWCHCGHPGGVYLQAQAWKTGMESKGLCMNMKKTNFKVSEVGLDVPMKSGKYVCAVCCKGVSSYSATYIPNCGCRPNADGDTLGSKTGSTFPTLSGMLILLTKVSACSPVDGTVCVDWSILGVARNHTHTQSKRETERDRERESESERERESVCLSAFLGTEDIRVHIVHINRLIITYTLE